MNEWGFGGEIKSWWDAELAANPHLGLGRCELERSSEGSHRRADLTLLADDGRVNLIHPPAVNARGATSGI
ncbi:MAG: hypothetical protein H0T40_01445 [Geodermatophilaceae bacterium]|nr:hypothetical protein [Geodermatophilaceae bacterium]